MGRGGFPPSLHGFILGPPHGSVGRLYFLAIGSRPLALGAPDSLVMAKADSQRPTALFNRQSKILNRKLLNQHFPAEHL